MEACSESKYFDGTILEEEVNLVKSDFDRAKTVEDMELPVHGLNPLTIAGKFEGDIDGIPTAGHLRDYHKNAIRNDYYKWSPSEVPYAISSQYSSYSRARIAAAIQEYEKHTCIRFIQRTAQRDYIYMVPGKGCYSMAGKAGGRQILSLGYGCIHKGIIMHELMHALGFFHEQSRSDRDDYVQVVWKNIFAGMESQFKKYSLNQIQLLDTEYDYGSLMHYGPRDFSKNGLDTIIPRRYGVSIGQRRGFSTIDKLKLNRLYQCYDKKTTMKPKSNCRDIREDCQYLVGKDYCTYSPYWMSRVCAKSCRFCEDLITTEPPCKDTHKYCDAWYSLGYCTVKKYNEFFKENCPLICGFC